MIQLMRRTKVIGVLVGVFLALCAEVHRLVRALVDGAWPREISAAMPESSHLADVREADITAAVREKQRTQIAPPPATSNDSIPLPMRWISARPQQEDEFRPPSWAKHGTGLMPIFTGHYASASTLG